MTHDDPQPWDTIFTGSRAANRLLLLSYFLLYKILDKIRQIQ